MFRQLKKPLFRHVSLLNNQMCLFQLSGLPLSLDRGQVVHSVFFSVLNGESASLPPIPSSAFHPTETHQERCPGATRRNCCGLVVLWDKRLLSPHSGAFLSPPLSLASIFFSPPPPSRIPRFPPVFSFTSSSLGQDESGRPRPPSPMPMSS